MFMRIVEMAPRRDEQFKQVKVLPPEMDEWYEESIRSGEAYRIKWAETAQDFVQNFDEKYNLTPDEGIQPQDTLAVNKPPFLTSLGSGNFDMKELARIATDNHDFHPVHRLDRDTSGVLLFGSTKRSRRVLHQAFEKHAISKQYIAIIDGYIPDAIAGVHAPLLGGKSQESPLARVDYEGKKAATGFQKIAAGENPDNGKQFTIMQLKLHTGRTHQIRAHSSRVLKHPIVGDHQYNPWTKDADRQLLHAYSLGFSLFDHEGNENQLHYKAPIPDDFFEFLSGKQINSATEEYYRIFNDMRTPPPTPQEMEIPPAA